MNIIICLSQTVAYVCKIQDTWYKQKFALAIGFIIFGPQSSLYSQVVYKNLKKIQSYI